jgi:hypothetical protein
VANKQLSPKASPPKWESNLRSNWNVVRSKGRIPFYVMFAFAVVALACDIVLVASVASWPWLSHLSQTQQLIYMLAAIALVLVVAPLISVIAAKRVWNWLDRLLSDRFSGL